MSRLILALVLVACIGSDAFACGGARRTPVRTFLSHFRPANRPVSSFVERSVHRVRTVATGGCAVGGCANGVCPAPAPKLSPIVPLKK